MTTNAFSIAYFLDHDGAIHHGACTTATTMGAAGDREWARKVVDNGDARPCDCLIGPLVTPGPTFVARVNAGLTRHIGFPTTWEDLVGDWPEADYAEADDVDGAVEWILDDLNH